MITLYGYSPSGNCHKLRMLLGHLGRDCRWIETDSAHGATRTPGYLAKNPNGKVPMLELDDGRVMVESNAILTWLADGTPCGIRAEAAGACAGRIHGDCLISAAFSSAIGGIGTNPGCERTRASQSRTAG